MTNALTQAQKRVFEALSSFIKERGYAPSFRELAQKTGLKSLNTIHFHLKKLEELGFAKRAKGRYRGTSIVGDPDTAIRSVRIPVLGSVPAGPLNLAADDYGEFIEVDRSFAKGKVFGLRVKGESMKDAGILEGDVVIVKVQPAAEDGEIVVARSGDEATVKILKKRKEGILLVPANEKYKPIPAKGMELLGKVTGVIRTYERY